MASHPRPSAPSPPSSRRHILPPERLHPHGARPISAPAETHGATTAAGQEAIGVSLCPTGSPYTVDVRTSRGSSIGNEGEMEGLTAELEGLANSGGPADDESDASGCGSGRRGRRRRRRRLCPPEIVFPGALVSVRFRRASPPAGDGAEEEEDGGGEGVAFVEVRFDARSALAEWAEAHASLAPPARERPAPPASSSSSSPARESFRGVSVLQAADARLWSEHRRRQHERHASDPDVVTEFHYDWTYSTPYVGTLLLSASSGLPGRLGRRSTEWEEVAASGLSPPLLTDTTQPILYFDDVCLYEDDLHDNGASVLGVKVRVMPACLLILSRLFVRVDYVVVRVRDARVFHQFGTSVVYRDVTWRECRWEDLVGTAGLPDDVGSWRAEDGASPMRQQQFQAMLGRVPATPLPEDLLEHSRLDLGALMAEGDAGQGG